MKSNPNELADQTPDASALSKFAVAFVFCSAILTLFLLLRPLRLQLTLDLSASRPSIAQLFYDVGAGFNEKDSGKAQVHAENPGQFETLSFSLPNATVVHLRFDPTTNDEGVVLRNVGISDGHKSLVKIPLSNLLPLNQIQDRTQQANQVILKPTPAANDPSIELKLRSPIDCKRLVRHYRRLSILLANGILLLCMGGGFYLSAFLSKLTGRVAGTFGTGHRYFARVAQRLSVPGALELDSYCIWFYAICALGFLIFSAADLNGSSIGVYSTVWGNGAPETSWIGSPRLIRSDEWAYATPDILHQVLRAEPFDVRTSARGGYSIALLDSVPVKHFTTIFRPQFWGFFVLPLDYGYAFYWQFKWLILITGVFTWLRFLTRSTFWSICGSLWFFWSPFTQWSYSWSTRLPEMIGEICWLMVLVCVISVERRTTVLIMAGLGIVYGAIDFALCGYLPHMVPLCWLAALFIAAWCVSAHNQIFTRPAAGRRLAAALGALGIIAIVGLFVFIDLKAAIQAIGNTDYPGRREFAGASAKPLTFTAHFLQWTETEMHLPEPITGNISEASGFLWIAPVTLFIMRRVSQTHFQKAALLSLWLCFALTSAWLLFPIPRAIARLFAMTYTAEARCYSPMGLANVAIVALCMACCRPAFAVRGRYSLTFLCRVLGVLIVYYFLVELTNQLLGSYFSQPAVWLAICLPTVFTVLILEGKSRLLGTGLVLSAAIAFGSVNPLERGLGVITNSQLYKLVRNNRSLLNGRWLVYSEYPWRSGFVEATGCDTYTGMRFVPDIDHFRLFASRGLNIRIFNNDTYLMARPIPSSAQSSFEAVGVTNTRWNVSPADPIMRALNIKYFAFDERPSGDIARGLVPIRNTTVDNMWLYRLP